MRLAAVSGLNTLRWGAPALVLSVVPSLAKLLGDPSAPIRRKAAAIIATQGEPALQELILGCGDPDTEVREVAIRGIAQIGTRAREAFPILLENLSHDSPAVRGAAIDALKTIGAMGEPLVIESAIRRLEAETVSDVADKLSTSLAGIPQARSAIDLYERRKEVAASCYEAGGDHEEWRRSDPGGFGAESGFRNIMGNWGE